MPAPWPHLLLDTKGPALDPAAAAATGLACAVPRKTGWRKGALYPRPEGRGFTARWINGLTPPPGLWAKLWCVRVVPE